MAAEFPNPWEEDGEMITDGTTKQAPEATEQADNVPDNA